jgi:hypothetical protein
MCTNLFVFTSLPNQEWGTAILPVFLSHKRANLAKITFTMDRVNRCWTQGGFN